MRPRCANSKAFFCSTDSSEFPPTCDEPSDGSCPNRKRRFDSPGRGSGFGYFDFPPPRCQFATANWS